MSVNVMAPTRTRLERKGANRITPATLSVAEPERYKVSPQLVRAISGVITSIRNSFVDCCTDIENIVIKGDKVYLQYRIQPLTLEENTLLEEREAVSRSLFQVINIIDGKVVEQLDTVYQVKTSLAL